MLLNWYTAWHSSESRKVSYKFLHDPSYQHRVMVWWYSGCRPNSHLTCLGNMLLKCWPLRPIGSCHVWLVPLALSYNSFYFRGGETTMNLCLNYRWLGNSFLPSISVSYGPLLHLRHNPGYFCVSFHSVPFSFPSLFILSLGLNWLSPENYNIVIYWLQSLSLLIGSWYPNAPMLGICSQKLHFHTTTAWAVCPCFPISLNIAMCVQGHSSLR